MKKHRISLSRPCRQYLGRVRWLGYRNNTMIDAT